MASVQDTVTSNTDGEEIPPREDSPLFEPDLTTPTANSHSPPPVPPPVYPHSSQSSPSSPISCSPPTPTRALTMDPILARARNLKTTLSTSPYLSPTTTTTPGAPKPTLNRRRNVEDDPENILIKTLRQDDNMGWGPIANFLNAERLKRGEPQTMTQAAVYSRFVRNAPKIAAMNGEVGFDIKDFMHLRHPHNYPGQGFMGAPKARKRKVDADPIDAMHGYGASASGAGFIDDDEGAGGENEDGEAEDDDEDQEWRGHGHRAIRLRSKLDTDSAELETAEKTGQLVDAVAVVQRNFWVFVADELERTTGKFYDVRALESRWKSI